jgi:hypothetical protein
MPGRGWSQKFEQPIELPGAQELITLSDAAEHIAALSRREAEQPEWQLAIEALMLIAEEGGPTMLARVAILRALGRNIDQTCSADGRTYH